VWALVLLTLRRSLSQQTRHPFIAVLNNVMPLLSAAFLALIYMGEPAYVAPQPIEVFTGCQVRLVMYVHRVSTRMRIILSHT
jgi:hypothetical protein